MDMDIVACRTWHLPTKPCRNSERLFKNHFSLNGNVNLA